jgi:hypothetical protein
VVAVVLEDITELDSLMVYAVTEMVAVVLEVITDVLVVEDITEVLAVLEQSFTKLVALVE